MEVVPVAEVDEGLIELTAQRTAKAFGGSYSMASERVPLAEEAYDPQRSQHEGGALLGQLRRRSGTRYRYVLGIADADLYASGLNFVFG